MANPLDSAGRVTVAVGVMFREDGAVLLAQRPADKPYGGWWEFPGGKLESGETVSQALKRELNEELGIEVLADEPLRIIDYDYPHARVRLYFRQIRSWRGELTSREGQQLRWQQPKRIEVAPLLPAAQPVIEWLRERC
jgi:8-oxo-dGTP diphosphatase